MLSTKNAQSNEFIEITLESNKKYANPFNEIIIDVVFTEPSGRTLCIPAFWSGNNTWRFRYSSTALGIHHFITECSDQHNLGLHQISGEINISPYSGNNPLLRHGALRIADDNRHFAHADGTPFLWLGDTWWMGLTKRLIWPEQFKQLTDDRKTKGFNVVQIVAGLYPDMPAFDERGANENGFPWEQDYSSIRPQFFDAADKRIMHLVEQGIVPCIVGCWGFHLLWLGAEKMKQHWRYIVARWGALPVVWAAAGEQTMPWYLSEDKEKEKEQLKEQWSEVIRYLRQIDGFQRLVTTHPHRSARESVDDPHLLDFEMQQTGHHNPTELHAASASQGWSTKPIMPVISAESRYEALSISPPVTTRDARQAFWAHLLNSGCAGHTYGANGVWQVNQPDRPFGKSPGGNDWGSLTWNEAMQLVGSNQLAAAKRFLLTLPWYNLHGICKPKSWLATIRFASLLSSVMPKKPAVAAAASPDGKIALYYLLYKKPVEINMQRFSAKVHASWIDPANGHKKAISNKPYINKGKFKFSPPSKNSEGDTDWILFLEAK
jgi:hypothetical protein